MVDKFNMNGKTNQWLALSLLLLAIGIALNSVLGPFISGIISYPFSDTVLNMTVGLDAVSLIFVAPISIIAAGYVYRGQQIGYIAAISISAYALYTFVQLVLGPQYIQYSPIVLLHLTLFILSGFIFMIAWQHVKVKKLPRFNRQRKKIIVTVLFLLAIFTSLSYIASIPQIFKGGTIPLLYVNDPTVYWSIFFLDLGFVLPITIAVLIGLIRNRDFAEKAVYGMVGWYTLVVTSVAVMFVAMFVNGVSNVNAVTVLVLLSVTFLVMVFSGWVLQPLAINRKR